jgi:isopentenyldiphosphate isomerase
MHRTISQVFIYTSNEKFSHPDGEVESYEWRTLDEFKEMAKHPEAHTLVPMGNLYFGTLVTALEHIAAPKES